MLYAAYLNVSSLLAYPDLDTCVTSSFQSFFSFIQPSSSASTLTAALTSMTTQPSNSLHLSNDDDVDTSGSSILIKVVSVLVLYVPILYSVFSATTSFLTTSDEDDDTDSSLLSSFILSSFTYIAIF